MVCKKQLLKLLRQNKYYKTFYLYIIHLFKFVYLKKTVMNAKEKQRKHYKTQDLTTNQHLVLEWLAT